MGLADEFCREWKDVIAYVLNIIVGYAGLFQLGHAAFFAVGASTVGIRNL